MLIAVVTMLKDKDCYHNSEELKVELVGKETTARLSAEQV